MNEFNRLYLHTGSNLGERESHLEQANKHIEKRIGSIARASGVFETKPWGIEDQPDFLNQALEVQTRLSPFEVLEQILQIEKRLGRQREIKWGARLIDIDILFYNEQIIDTPKLSIPHPYLQHRNFVLIPMLEIAPDLIHPVFGKTIEELYALSNDPLLVEAFK